MRSHERVLGAGRCSSRRSVSTASWRILVGQRTREIGIRMALGAARADVQRLIMGQATRLTLVGVGIGLAAAYGLTRFMVNQLFGVRPDDPPTFVVVTVILAASAVFAAWLPVARAVRVDPVVALRHE